MIWNSCEPITLTTPEDEAVYHHEMAVLLHDAWESERAYSRALEEIIKEWSSVIANETGRRVQRDPAAFFARVRRTCGR